MTNDELKSRIVTFLDDYTKESTNTTKPRWIKASDYLKAIDMLYKINVEVNKDRMLSDKKIIINFDLDLTDDENDGDIN